MFRKTARLFAALLFTLCCLAPTFASAQTVNAPSNPYNCIASNRNWVCNAPGKPGVPVTQCIETVRNGAVVQQKNYSFNSTAALQAFLSMAPSGSSYQLCGATPACTQTTQDQTLACPSGQTGQIVQRRTVNVGGVCGVNSDYTEISNTCRAIPTCTQTTETTTAACPAGQIGSITKTRTVNVGGECGVNSEYTETSNTCRVPPANCTFNGQTVLNGQSVTAYSTQTTPYGTTCVSQTRTCTDGVLSGNYQYSDCTVNPPAVCTFNGKTLKDGESVTAYREETTPYGTTCTSETRTCTNGSLSGSYGYTNCTVNPPKTCTFNGKTLQNGESVTAYKETTVGYGKVCESETRKCTDGTLSGSYTAVTCSVTPPATCTFNGQVLKDGESVTAYATQTTAYGTTCVKETRTCTNGSLSGSYGYTNCTVNPPATCSFNGKTLNDGESVTAYSTQTTPYGTTCASETRTCHNGQLSGNYNYSTCSVTPPATCTFNGQVLQSGQSVTAYETANTPYGSVCKSETRTCTNGSLSGSYGFTTCSVNPPLNCTTPWGMTVANGDSVTAYQAPTAGGTSATAGDAHAETNGICVSETRTCTNGVLSGSFTYQSCNQQCGTSTETRTGVTACPAGQSGTITETRIINVGQQCGVNSEWQVVSNTCAANLPDIPTVMAQNPTIYSTFRNLLDITGLIPGLSCPETGTCYGPFTVFAPRNEAFNTVPPAALQAWQQPANYDVLRQVLRTHIVNGKYLKSVFNGKTTDLATQSGYAIRVTVPAGSQGTVSVVGSTDTPANVVEWDRLAKNGVIHTIDRVLMPVISCPAGQEYLQNRYVCAPVCQVGTTRDPATGQCTGNICSFNGQTLQSGQSVTAFSTGTTPYGTVCQSETRTCTNGVLSGSYNYSSCTPGQPATCTFNGQVLQNGQSVTAYQSQTTPYGTTCVSETRTCTNGQLSGSYGFTNCSVGPAQNCTFNGQAVANGQSVTAYSTNTTPYGTVCQSETRTCTNGQLSGSYNYSNCTPGQPATCTFNGQVIQNGQSVTAYSTQSSPYGTTCASETRTCSNGQLSGSYNYSNCTVEQPKTCTFNGQTLQNGQSVMAYQSSSVAYGQQCQAEYRTCTNGVLSGSFTNSSCQQQQAQNCTFNGQTVQNGQSVSAYRYSTVAYGNSCYGANTETRTCNNGVLSGSFQYSSCTTQPAQSCTGPDGRTIASGTSVTYYAQSNPAEGSYCQSQVRTCTNGQLSGNFTAGNCTQVICTVAQAGDAYARACTTSTYASAGQTSSHTSTTYSPANNGGTVQQGGGNGGYTAGDAMCAYGSTGCIDNYVSNPHGSSSSNNSSGSSSSSSSSSSSNGSVTVNNSNSNANNNTSVNNNQSSVANNNSSNASNQTSVAVSNH